MDMLLSAFVNKFIEKFDEAELVELEKFLNFEDEIIYNYYHYKIIKVGLIKIKFQSCLKISSYNGGEGGIRTTNELPVAGFQDQCFQPLSHLS